MYALEWLACGIGIGAGWAARWIATAATRRIGRSGFWGLVARLTRSLVTPQADQHLFREYLRLWPALFQYLGQQLLVMIIALLPVVVAFMGLTALVDGWPGTRSIWVHVSPQQPCLVELAGRSQRLEMNSYFVAERSEWDGSVWIETGGTRWFCVNLSRKQAYASDPTVQWLLVALGFELLKAESPFDGDLEIIVLRSTHGDNNPFWPYLSDWELDFFVVAGLASAVAAWLGKRST